MVAAYKRGTTLPMVTIYKGRTIFPDEYVARLWLTRRGVKESPDRHRAEIGLA
jgi:hypothetical protein